ncbi:hypothetical protein PCE1_003262 [Barthelona sp. PCE]
MPFDTSRPFMGSESGTLTSTVPELTLPSEDFESLPSSLPSFDPFNEGETFETYGVDHLSTMPEHTLGNIQFTNPNEVKEQLDVKQNTLYYEDSVSEEDIPDPILELEVDSFSKPDFESSSNPFGIREFYPKPKTIPARVSSSFNSRPFSFQKQSQQNNSLNLNSQTLNYNALPQFTPKFLPNLNQFEEHKGAVIYYHNKYKIGFLINTKRELLFFSFPSKLFIGHPVKYRIGQGTNALKIAGGIFPNQRTESFVNGTVQHGFVYKWLRFYGFLKCQCGLEVYFTKDRVRNNVPIREGDVVKFNAAYSNGKPQARNVEVLGRLPPLLIGFVLAVINDGIFIYSPGADMGVSMNQSDAYKYTNCIFFSNIAMNIGQIVTFTAGVDTTGYWQASNLMLLNPMGSGRVSQWDGRKGEGYIDFHSLKVYIHSSHLQSKRDVELGDEISFVLVFDKLIPQAREAVLIQM